MKHVSENPMDTCSTSSCCNMWIVGIASALIAVLGVSGVLFYFEHRTLLREYEKYDGKENYRLVQKAQRKQFLDQFDKQQVTDFIEGKTQDPAEEKKGPTSFTSEDLVLVKKDASIEGNPEGRILLVEYSDMECPFCIRQHNDSRAIQEVRAKYGSSVGTIFKNYRAVRAEAHPGAEAKAIGAICAGKVGGTSSYAKFYGGIFAKSQSAMMNVSELGALAKEIGLDVARWNACVASPEAKSQFAAESAEAQRMGVTGTPGTLIIDTKTLKTDFVAGAYPKETFFAKIDALLAE